MNGSPVECKVAEIPAETKRLEELLGMTSALINEVQGKFSPVLADPVEGKCPSEKATRADSPLGNWLKDRNESIEEMNDLLKSILRRVRL